MISFVLLLALSFVSAVEWKENTYYAIGNVVTYNGKTYECIQAHTAIVGWQPPNVPALWKEIVVIPDDGSWRSGVVYNVGDVVTYNNLTYVVRQAHTSQSDWTPDITPALFVTDVNSDYKSELVNQITAKYGESELKGWEISEVHASVKIITYDITLTNSVTGEKKNLIWMVQG